MTRMEGALSEETREYDLKLISDAIRLEKFTFFCKYLTARDDLRARK